MQGLQIIEIKGVRVLTSRQLAELYESNASAIKKNYSNNRYRFIKGKHYIELTGDELKLFKDEVKDIHLVAKQAKCLYLWTEKGALLHAKSLNTDKAWEVYDWLVDFYFRARECGTHNTRKNITNQQFSLDIPGNQEVQKKICEIKHLCISIQCMMDLYNRYIDVDEAAALRRASYALGAQICSELFKIEKIKLEPKV